MFLDLLLPLIQVGLLLVALDLEGFVAGLRLLEPLGELRVLLLEAGRLGGLGVEIAAQAEDLPADLLQIDQEFQLVGNRDSRHGFGPAAKLWPVA